MDAKSKRDIAARYMDHVSKARRHGIPCCDDMIECFGSLLAQWGELNPGRPPDRAHDNLREIIGKFEADKSRYSSEVIEATELVNRLKKQAHYELLRRHYIDGESYEQVAREMHYTKDGIYSLRRAALSALFDLMPANLRARYGEAPSS